MQAFRMNNWSLNTKESIDPDDADIAIQRRDLFRFIRVVLKLGGAYPLDWEPYFPNGFKWVAALCDLLCELCAYFLTLHIAVLYLCTIYINREEGSLELIANCLMQFFIFGWAFVVKVYFRRWKPMRQKELVDIINLHYKTRSALGFTYVTMDESLNLSSKWAKSFVGWALTGVWLWLLFPFINGDGSLPLNTCWYPFDYSHPLVYATLFILQACGQLQVNSSFSGCTSFYMVHCMLISGQYDVLYCSLKNIIATSHIEMGATKEQLLQLRKYQEVANDEPQQYYCAVEKSVSIKTLMRASEMIDKKPTNFLVAFRRSFKSCIQHHRYILETLKKVEDFWSPLYLWKTGSTMLLLCITAFVSVKSTAANSAIRVFTLGQYFALLSWEMLILCYFGEIITRNSTRCGEALLRSPWYLHMREMKSDFLLFLLNSQRSFKLTGGKIYKLNIERFRIIQTTAFSFLTILQKMDQRPVNKP